jgi:feruloyl esterase
MDLGASQLPLGGQTFGTQCASLVQPIVAGAEILSLQAAEVHNYSCPAIPFFNPVEVNSLSFCNVSVTLTHPGASDTVFVSVWLPLSDWNGRYQATGGGGLAAGMGPLMMGTPLHSGYATSSTDGGLTLNNTVDPQTGKWALKEDGTSNEDLQLNLAWRSIHDMVVVSKELIKQFYGVAPSYSYWHGCSQGGRQGYAAAAKYPHDFDGILAIAPAIDLPELVVSDLWPPVLMQNSFAPPFCIFEEYQKAIISKCDPLDGAVDGLISDYDLLESCPFDPDSLIGQVVPCDFGCTEFDPDTLVKTNIPCEELKDITITADHADLVRKILQGPRTPEGKSLWYGVAPGASFFAVAKTVAGENDTFVPVPFFPSIGWVKYFTFQNPEYDIKKMTQLEYVKAFEVSASKLGLLWGNQHLDLTDFKQSGGKLLTWFGLADEYIPPNGMLRYRENLEKQFGGAEAVDEFQRLFFAPGVGHCFGGHGPVPVDALSVLRAWVENGTAPEVLPAVVTTPDNVEVSRSLCRYPKKLVYQDGDVNLASSFSCE